MSQELTRAVLPTTTYNTRTGMHTRTIPSIH